MTSAFAALLKRDLTLVARTLGDYTRPVLFFVVCTTLFSFAAGTGRQMLATFVPVMMWVSALLS